MPSSSAKNSTLLRDISIILVIKLAVLFLIWEFFFNGNHVELDTNALTSQFFQQQAQGEAL